MDTKVFYPVFYSNNHISPNAAAIVLTVVLMLVIWYLFSSTPEATADSPAVASTVILPTLESSPTVSVTNVPLTSTSVAIPTPPVSASTLMSSIGRYVILERVAANSLPTRSFAVNGIAVLNRNEEEIRIVDATAGSTENVYGPANLMDNKHNSMAKTLSSTNFSTLWLKVDLGSDKEIGTVLILNNPTYKERLVGTRIRIINNAGNTVYRSNPFTNVDQLNGDVIEMKIF